MRKYLSDSLAHHTEYANINSELVSGLFRNYTLLPYFFQYKYFNLINLETGKNYSFFYATDGILTRINGLSTRPGKPIFVTFDFGKHVMQIDHLKVIDQGKNFMKADDFEFTINGKTAYISFDDKSFDFNKVISDTSKGNVLGLYATYTLKMQKNNLYFMAQNVVVRGPLTSWVWLDFYLNDGTYINLFHTLERKPNLRVNNELLPVNRSEITDQSLVIEAVSGDKFLNLKIALDSKLTCEIKPFLMPNWEYNQYRATLENIESNIVPISSSTKGTGLAEWTKGFTF